MSAFQPSSALNESRFLSLLELLISESRYLQNNPSQGLIPTEDRASDHVLKALAPYTKQNGGVLEVERVTFVEGRGNVMITYPGTVVGKVCSFVGSHLDVVPADAKGWDRDPFKLTIEGDFLYGRGTTDCLGHVALLTDFMITLAEQKPALRSAVTVVFIANEENGSFVGVGVDQLSKEGYLDSLKKGPLFWIDAADSMPCIGTAGNLTWQLVCKGKLFHSGLPHKGINAIEFAMDAVSYIQQRFYTEFPQHPREIEYNFATQSTFKPTQVSCTPGSLNQIPPECIMQGDVRISPFYDYKVVKERLTSYVAEVAANPSMVEAPQTRGPHSKYTLSGDDGTAKIEIKWLIEGENGVACKLDSEGYRAIVAATGAVLGDTKPYSIGGSLPLIRALQDDGFDVQISGYGISSRYHADNEAASLQNFRDAFQILSRVVTSLESSP